MQIDPAQHPSATGYKILTNVVVPRPIAWVSSLSTTGVINLAPISFFNAVGSEPLYVAISLSVRADGTVKDTAKNIDAHGEFVVNLVTEALLSAMNITAADFPPGESELVAAELRGAPSVKIRAPRLAESQVSLECKLFTTQTAGFFHIQECRSIIAEFGFQYAPLQVNFRLRKKVIRRILIIFFQRIDAF